MPSLSDYFRSSAAIEVRGRPVSFRAIRRTDELVAVEVRALLTFVDEAGRAEAHREADRALAKQLAPGEFTSDTARDDERIFHVLWRALRDIDPPHSALCRSVDELRGAVTLPVVQELWAEYQRFLAEEFPPYVDADEFKKLVEAARTEAFFALPARFDSDFIRKSLPGLAVLLPASPTQK